MKIKPLLKWAGGKGKLLPHILENAPPRFNNYFECFLGGGALLFELLNTNRLNQIEIAISVSDINANLINFYNIVKDRVEELITELENPRYKSDEEGYLSNRTAYNDTKEEGDAVHRAALFLYLNKCGFNGLYRENSKGKFNVPFGTLKTSSLIDKDLLRTVSQALVDNRVSIKCCVYQSLLEVVQEGDFCYMDPPYDGTFSEYTKNPFGKEEQIELKQFVDALTAKKVNVLLSNSATDFIKDLYKDYRQINIETKYSINSKGADRKNKKSEVLIKNY